MAAEEFDTRLQQALERARLSQADLARRIGSHPNLVNNWVTGKSHPSLEHLAAIAPALDVGIDWLVLGAPPPPALLREESIAERVRSLSSELIELVELARESAD
jgi:transcriptional regulator with XRE-family HTH domain